MKVMAKADKPLWNQMVAAKLKSFPVYIQRSKWQSATAYHWQPGVEIHVTQEGSGALLVDKHVLPQHPRQVVIFRGSVPHQLIANAAYKRTVVCLDLETVFHEQYPKSAFLDFSWIPENAYCSFTLDPVQYAKLDELCQNISSELERKQPGWGNMALALALQMTVLLQRAAESRQDLRLRTSESCRRKNNLVQKCADYVCANIGEDLSLKTVAKKFAVSEEYLTRCFKKEMGISFYQYVLLQRVAEGKKMLREAADASIAYIAYSLGFPSSSHFCRTFKAFTDETPSAYRQRISKT